jgi:hypothetical protein
MKTRLLLVFALASGMALAQSGNPPNSPENQPQSNQPQTGQDQQQTPAPPQADQNNQGTSSTAPDDSAGNKMRGCLYHSGDNWFLSTKGHQHVAVSGDNSMLQAHDGQEVEVQGQRAQGNENSPPSFHITSMNTISQSCSK